MPTYVGFDQAGICVHLSRQQSQPQQLFVEAMEYLADALIADALDEVGQGVDSRPLPANYPTNPLAIAFLKPTGDVSELWLPDLGDRIRQKRRQLGIILVELADHIGVSLSAAVYWEGFAR